MGRRDERARKRHGPGLRGRVGVGTACSRYTCFISDSIPIWGGAWADLSPVHFHIFSVLVAPPPSLSSPLLPSTLTIHRSPSPLPRDSLKATCSTAMGSSSFSSRRETRFEADTSRLNKTDEVVGSTNWSVEGWEEGRTIELVGGWVARG